MYAKLTHLVLVGGAVGASIGIPSLVSETTGEKIGVDPELLKWDCSDEGVGEKCTVTGVGGDKDFDEEFKKENQEVLKTLGVQSQNTPLSTLAFLKKSAGGE